MANTTALDLVRQHVRRQFAVVTGKVDEIAESFLVRDGHYCGRKFQADGVAAIWFCEENEIKFYGPDRRLIACVRTEASPAELALPRAA